MAIVHFIWEITHFRAMNLSHKGVVGTGTFLLQILKKIILNPNLAWFMRIIMNFWLFFNGT